MTQRSPGSELDAGIKPVAVRIPLSRAYYEGSSRSTPGSADVGIHVPGFDLLPFGYM